ncbi:MAG: undecaprenyl-phosphate glucose phosphotransferase [Alphaproteobacteria bacterium]|nr:undecaprenyl-phosphate glucose phosphotransferase [Alphaproteobacteria bacterium]
MTDLNATFVHTRELPRRATALTKTSLLGIARAVDAVAVVLPGISIYALYVLPGENEISSRYAVAFFVTVIVALLNLQWFGTYRKSFILGRNFAIGRLIGALAMTAAGLLVLAFALKITGFYSRVWATSWLTGAIASLIIGRIIFRAWITDRAQAGRFAIRTAIVGVGERAAGLVRQFGSECGDSISILGFVDDRRDATASGGQAGYGSRDTLGGLTGLVAMIRDGAIDQVIVAIPWHEHQRLRTVINRLAETPVDIRLAPENLAPEFRGRSYVDVAGLPMLGVLDRPISGWDYILKALEDRVLGSLILLAISPILGLIALAIRLDSPGPVLFRQIRYGYNNRPIEVLKFRSMYSHLEDRAAEVLTTRDDPRVTPVGKFLRKWSLDELPQFINVVRGDMSIVGPRPHGLAAKAAGRRYEEVANHYAARHKVKPGITGWAQVNGWRGETDTVEKIEKRVEYDLDYIKNWSIWFDLYIAAKTILVVFDNRETY